MGPGGGATEKDLQQATRLGQLIAKKGWILLTGGRDAGVMEAASKGAQQSGGTTVGILPSSTRQGMSEHIDIPICTGIGSARNNINILSSDVVIACGNGAGTTSEIMLALKSSKPLILVNPSQNLLQFLRELPYSTPKVAEDAQKVIPLIQEYL